jgi:DNA-binding MarR family transcriptional regulator
MFEPTPALIAGQGLTEAITDAVGALGGQSVLFSQAMASRLDIHPSDVECLTLLADRGPAAAGRLAELTGLTTGAVTRMIDRLEHAGYVRRVDDKTDRRRVIVELVPDRMKALAPYYDALHEAFEGLLGAYTFQQQIMFLDLLRRSEWIMRTEAARLRDQEARPQA